MVGFVDELLRAVAMPAARTRYGDAYAIRHSSLSVFSVVGRAQLAEEHHYAVAAAGRLPAFMGQLLLALVIILMSAHYDATIFVPMPPYATAVCSLRSTRLLRRH